MKSNLSTVIIRSVGERTEALCKKLIIEQGVPEIDVFIVNEVPFSKSLLYSLELGVKQAKKYTLCIDADVLLRPNAIKTLVDVFEVLPQNICEIQGYVYDKFFGGARSGGIHLYRTSLLPKMIELVKNNQETIRPETFALNQMKSAGFPWLKIDYAIGLHDEEQYFEDIYRKCFVHGVKHLKLAELFIENWKDGQNEDEDLKVALVAFADSLLHSQEVFINKNDSVYSQGFKKHKIEEKKPLNEQIIDLNTIEQMVLNFSEHPKFIAINPFMERFMLKKPNPEKIRSLSSPFRNVLIIFSSGLLDILQLFIKPIQLFMTKLNNLKNSKLG